MEHLAELEGLSQAARQLLTQPGVTEQIAQLKVELQKTSEPFVWSTVELAPVCGLLPRAIRSGWIFVLREGTPSGAHHHPNSVQHMGVVEGQCSAHIGGALRALERGDWAIIPATVPHEFFPQGQDLVVLSFHTCAAEELQEVSLESGARRLYTA